MTIMAIIIVAVQGRERPATLQKIGWNLPLAVTTTITLIPIPTVLLHFRQTITEEAEMGKATRTAAAAAVRACFCGKLENSMHRYSQIRRLSSLRGGR
jgi:hypothetical protein